MSMTWLCDFERCYRTARLYVLSDMRRRPRCDKHKPKPGTGVLASEDDRITAALYEYLERNAFGKLEIPPAKDGEPLFSPVTAAPYAERWANGFVLRSQATGVPPNTGDYVGTAWPVKSSAGGVYAGNEANARYTFGCYGGSHSGPCDDKCVDPRKVESVKPIDKTLLDASTRRAIENVEMRFEGDTTSNFIRARTSDTAEMPPDQGPFPFDESKPAPTFKVGQWVRSVNTGMLHRVTEVGLPERTIRVEGSGALAVRFSELHFEPALPRAGEWWVHTRCDKHWPDAKQEEMHAYRVGNVAEDSACAVFVRCGCLVPKNYGRGEAK